VLGNEVPFTEADVETVEVLREVISVELQKSKPKLNEKGVMYEYFLKDLLDGKIRKDEVISERMKYLDLNLKENLYLVSVFTRQSDFLNTPLQYISNKFENLIIGCKSFVYNDQIIILISTDQAASSLKSDIEKLESFLEQNNMYAGMSQCFHKINHIRAYYKQAVKAVELGIYLKMGRPFIKYDDCSVYHVADICAHNHNLRRFCHPAVLKLEEYDRKNNTSYLKSLYYYLINNKNQLASAEALHIHRNTLIYRIKKIDLLVDIDWNDGETLFHLLFSFKFLKYLNCRETNKKE
jgi:sugar diacid utilization regulator